jgi:hypothetical protein
MDWKQILSKTPDTYGDEEKEHIYEELLKLRNDHKFDNRHYKKLFRLTLTILRMKGDQVFLI